MKPIVDGLEQQYAGRLIVIRLDIQNQTGRTLGKVYTFQYTPTFIFFDGKGNELWRSVGQLDSIRLQAALK